MLIVHDERLKIYTFLLRESRKSLFILFLLIIMPWTKVWADGVSGQISRVGDTTHLEFKGLKEWNYGSPKKIKDKLYLTVPAFDDKTQMQIQTWSGPLVKNIKINKSAPDGKYELIFQLASDDVESFDYLTDEPSSLIFDFFKKAETKKEVTVAPKPKKKKRKSKLAAKLPEKIINGGFTKKDRAPASSELLTVNTLADAVKSEENAEKENREKLQFERGVFDAGDPNYDRFRVKNYEIHEDAIIASRENVYIKFPMLQQKINRFNELMKNSPIYEIKPEENQENKEARLLLTLFEKKRWASFLTTQDYFEKKYPNSKYLEIIKNMSAETHIHLYERDHDLKDYDAYISTYKYLVEKYPDSVLTERNQLLLGYAALDRGDGVSAIQNLEKYLSKYPNSSEKDHLRMALAEAYMSLNKYEDAEKTYNDIIKSPLDKNYAIEATYRLGDISFSEKKYDKAIEQYQQAQSKYPDYKKIFPNAQYNLSESQFWTNKYQSSLDSYIEFLKLFPSHDYGGFALTRIGELQEIMGADRQKIMGAFIEGYFRYPKSQGSEVARIRMLSHGLKEMQDREKKQALAEIRDIAQKSTLPKIKEFSTLMQADGLSMAGEYKKSLNSLLTYFQENPTTVNLPVFRSRILRNISDILKTNLEKHEAIDALNFYGKYATTWLKNANRIDTRYFQALAFEQAGVPEVAYKQYIDILARLKSIAGKKEEKERQVYENLPTINQVNLRLASISMTQKKYQNAFQYLSDIKGDLSDLENIEKVQLNAAVAEQMGEKKRAIYYLEKLIAAHKNNKNLVIKPELNLARLYIEAGMRAEADKSLANIEKEKAENADIPDDVWSKALELRGDLQYASGQKIAAVDTYNKLLENFEKTLPLSSIRYKAGKILFDEGDLKGAENIWSKLDDKSGDLYKKIAAEKIHQAEWQDSYKKYIDRIPAAENLK